MTIETTGPVAIDGNGEVFTGYDSYEQRYSQTNRLRDFDAAESTEFASAAEKIALADKMIARWEAYKRSAI